MTQEKAKAALKCNPLYWHINYEQIIITALEAMAGDEAAIADARQMGKTRITTIKYTGVDIDDLLKADLKILERGARTVGLTTSVGENTAPNDEVLETSRSIQPPKGSDDV